MLIDFLLIGIPLYYFKKKKKSPAKELGLKKEKIQTLVKQTLILFSAVVIAALALTALMDFFGLNDLNNVTQALEPLSFAWLVYLFTVRIISEEIFFRGFIVKKLGALWSSSLFALAHITYGSGAEILGAFVLGFIMAKAFEKNKNLYPNIAAHFLYNLVAICFLV